MRYYIVANDYDLDGYMKNSYYVGYDNKAAYLEENYLTFNSEKEAIEWTKSKAAAEWASSFKFEICSAWFFDEIINDIKKIYQENNLSYEDADIDKAYQIAVSHEWSQTYTSEGLYLSDFEDLVHKVIK